MKNLWLYAIVSISGASVLAIEILGTRVLGPHYGVSLFLWSALISVTMIALSIGYAAGGRWADKGATPVRLCLLLGAAGLWTIPVPWLKQLILTILEPVGLRIAMLLAALILFFPPLFLLGMVSPYAVKIRTSNLGEVGRSAGNLYAISTFASVISALITGFFLIPQIGVTRLLLMIGFFLIMTAVIGIIYQKKTKARGGGRGIVAGYWTNRAVARSGGNRRRRKGRIVPRRKPIC